jgi:sulfatase maturation enzyme AslB (radical SAM superfamily)
LSWATLPNLQLVVSVDGLQAEHDVRRKPATYERILRNIQSHHIAVHCTLTSAMVQRRLHPRVSSKPVSGPRGPNAEVLPD